MNYLKNNYSINPDEYQRNKNNLNYLQNLKVKLENALLTEHKKNISFENNRKKYEETPIKNFEICFKKLYNRKPEILEINYFKELLYKKKYEYITEYLLKLQKQSINSNSNPFGKITNPDVPKSKASKQRYIQSVIFEKKYFKTKQQCVSWLKRQNKERSDKYDFVWGNYDETEDHHRFRQFDPTPGARHRIEEIDKGIKFIYEFRGPPPRK
jgi:hypothetical protein